jgi:hypothetical protein
MKHTLTLLALRIVIATTTTFIGICVLALIVNLIMNPDIFNVLK